jgi:hypothetical protein
MKLNFRLFIASFGFGYRNRSDRSFHSSYLEFFGTDQSDVKGHDERFREENQFLLFVKSTD